MTAAPGPVIVNPAGQPARTPADRICPRCHAGPEKRVLSSGFGEPHDVCARCGLEFEERTV